MTGDTVVVVQITRLEAAHLVGLVDQFAALLDASSDGAADDPAVRRLVPDAYEDADDADDFRAATEAELLRRRRADAARVTASLADVAAVSDDPADPALVESVPVLLDADDARAWLRTLAAIRLVLASRLGITDEEDHDDSDPRYGIYGWLGFRLDGLVRAIDGG